LELLLAGRGLTIGDVDMVEMPHPDMMAGLANGAVDVAMLSEPFVAQAVENGLVVRGKGFDEIDPYQVAAVIIYGPDFAQTEAAKRFMVGYLRGARDYADAFVKNRGRAEMVQFLARTTAIKEVALYDKMVPVWINP